MMIENAFKNFYNIVIQQCWFLNIKGKQGENENGRGVHERAVGVDGISGSRGAFVRRENSGVLRGPGVYIPVAERQGEPAVVRVKKSWH